MIILNKQNIKRITAAALFAVLLAGCGAESGNSTASDTVSTAASETSAVTETEAAASETSAETSAEAVSETSAEEKSEGYKVIVKDENGDPVEGATVQFCSDTDCTLQETGADGIAAFDSPAGSYTAHILMVPDGYSEDETEYSFSDDMFSLEIVLKKQDPDSEDSSEDKYTVKELDVPDFGISYKAPEKYLNTKGYVELGGYTINSEDPKINTIYMTYYAVSRDQLDEFANYLDEWFTAMQTGGETPEEPQKGWSEWSNLTCDFMWIVAADSGIDEDELKEYISEAGGESEIKELEKLETVGNTDFYFVRFDKIDSDADTYKEYMGEFYDEFTELAADKETFISSFTFSEPVVNEVNVGDKIEFETTDLDGNTITSEEIFSKHKVTMINLWATWCGPCKKELPELGGLAKEFEEKDAQIIGICLDADDPEKAEQAKELLSEAECGYLNLTPPGNVDEILPSMSIPMTVFVDSDGVVIAEKIVGAYVDRYPEVLDECLDAVRD